MQRNTGYFPTESLEPSGNRLFSRSALNEGDLFRGSLDSLMNLDLPEDEQAANDMRQLYLSCPPAARKVLLNSTRALTDELKEMVQTAGVDPDEHLENK